MDEYITQRMKTASLSKPNKKVIFVLKRNLVNLCRGDLEILSQLKEIFGLSQIPLDPRLKNYGNATGALETLRQKRQLIAASIAVVTSLITIFSTKELIAMSNGNEDEIIDSTNHIMGAISSQEARLVRLEAQQNQLSHHVKRLTDQFVLGVKTQDTFYDMFAVSTYGGYLNKHVKDIRDGLLLSLIHI